jgi:hypothetical protein
MDEVQKPFSVPNQWRNNIYSTRRLTMRIMQFKMSLMVSIAGILLQSGCITAAESQRERISINEDRSLHKYNSEAQANQINRVVILTDIEADPDDTQSLIRLLLYSNEIDIKGLIATTSVWQKTRVAPESIKKVIQAYGKVQPNLTKHEAGFPDAEALLMLVKQGLPKYGMLGVGDGKDSQGSDWIIKVLEEKDERPLWISVWGGANTLAQALYKIKNTKTETEAKRLIAKLRVYTISDQDDSGIWLRNNFPDLFYIVSPGDDYGSATWNAINNFVKGINNDEISNNWLAQNIQQGHGPLGAEYPDVA